MAKIEFFRDTVEKIETDKAVTNLAELYQSIRGAVETNCVDQQGKSTQFDLELLFADILKALGCLSYDHLSQVVGRGRSIRAWRLLKDQ